ncbi:hypothetical protein FJZ28_05260 [Candidatus Peregrinibacteria bacterium]|nr:hypothetical protein [Candidatus Peregrinibacteria bacterium]
MNDRQSRLLAAIIDEFITTAIPVGSKQIVEAGYLHVSGATIRNEMQLLSEEGFIEQPHVSAGRIPTAKGYRSYVREYMEPDRYEKQVRKKFESLKEQYLVRKDQERVYEAVALLTRMTPNVVFATVPHKDRVYYLGLSNTLKQPEFQSNPLMASGIVEVLESRLHDLLNAAHIDDQIRYYIGDENIMPEIHSCSLVVTKYAVRGGEGAIGILGPMRMDYGFNTVALDLVADMLRTG